MIIHDNTKRTIGRQLVHYPRIHLAVRDRRTFHTSPSTINATTTYIEANLLKRGRITRHSDDTFNLYSSIWLG